MTTPATPLEAVTSIPQLLRRSAAQFGGEIAVQCDSDSGARDLTFRELDQAASRGAALLADRGLKAGDPALLWATAGPEWVVALFSILRAGGIAVPIPADRPPAQAAAAAGYAGAALAVLGSALLPHADALSGLATCEVEDLCAAEAPHPAFAAPTRDPGNLALLAFTSGSTQLPKAVELTHANLLADLAALLQVESAGPGDAFLSMLPPAHLFELLGGVLGPLACGARIVFASSLLPHRLLESLRDREITHALAVPALLGALYDEVVEGLQEAGVLDRAPDRRALHPAALSLGELNEADRARLQAGVAQRIGRSLRSLVVGGAALDPAWGPLLRELGMELSVGYGLTEASPIVSHGRAHECAPGSVGRPLPGVEVQIAESGEILVRGATVMRGYFGDPDATAQALAGGWLHTGDRGRLDASGCLFVTGRLKEAMVTSSGETIHPEEIEPCYESPLFAEWCVVAVRAEDGNDLPTLVYVPRSPAAEDAALQREVRRLRGAVPPRLRVVATERRLDPLPRTATGKIQRTVLAQQLQLRREAP